MPKTRHMGACCRQRPIPICRSKRRASTRRRRLPGIFAVPEALGFFSRLLKGLGADRLLWGSDWPPVSRHVTYRQSLEIVRTFATELDEGDRAKVLGENAARVYGI